MAGKKRFIVFFLKSHKVPIEKLFELTLTSHQPVYFLFVSTESLSVDIYLNVF